TSAFLASDRAGKCAPVQERVAEMFRAGIDLRRRDYLPSSYGSAGDFSFQSIPGIRHAASGGESGSVAAGASQAGVRAVSQPTAGAHASRKLAAEENRRRATVLAV